MAIFSAATNIIMISASSAGVVLEENKVDDQERENAKTIGENTEIPKSFLGRAASSVAEDLRNSASNPTSSSTTTQSGASSSSEKMYECKVYCLDPTGSTKYTVSASSRSEAVDIIDKDAYQICRSAGFGRDTPDSMESHEKQCYEKR